MLVGQSRSRDKIACCGRRKISTFSRDFTYTQPCLIHNLDGNLLAGRDVNRQLDFGEAAAADRLLQFVEPFEGSILHHREVRYERTGMNAVY